MRCHLFKKKVADMGANVSTYPIPKKDVIDMEDLIEMAHNGDMILFSGIGTDSNCVRCFSNTRLWSHVGIVLEFDEKKWLFESARDWQYDEITGKKKQGVRLNELRTVIHTYHGIVLGIRKLSIRNDASVKLFEESNLKELVLELSHFTYTRDFLELYRSTARSNQDLGDNYFCVKLFVDVLDKLGVIVRTDLPNNYTLPDLAGDSHHKLNFNKGFKYGKIKFAFYY